MRKLEVHIGSVVAFNKRDDAVWFDVDDMVGFVLTVREHGTQNARRLIDRSYVKQVKEKVDRVGDSC